MIVEYGGRAGGGKTSDTIDLIASDSMKWYVNDALWNFLIANMGEEWTKALCMKLEPLPINEKEQDNANAH